jgi:hypothetical protein
MRKESHDLLEIISISPFRPKIIRPVANRSGHKSHPGCRRKEKRIIPAFSGRAHFVHQTGVAMRPSITKRTA